MKDSLNIAIAGATGYAGLELIKILSKHPKAKLLYLCATKSIGKPINKFYKGLKKYNLPKISKIDKINSCDKQNKNCDQAKNINLADVRTSVTNTRRMKVDVCNKLQVLFYK